MLSIEYILLTLFTSHYVVKLGVADAVRRIMKPIPSSNIHLSATIVSIEVDPLDPSSSRIFFSASSPTNHGGTSNSDSESQKHTSISGFDHVVLATQANNAIPLLTTLRSSVRTPKSAFQRSIDAQIDCLKRFKYIPTIVVNHTDEAFLPEREADRRDLNLVVWHERRDTSTRNYDPNVPCLPAGYAMATHDVRYRASSKSISSSPSKRNYILQTTNPIHPPSPSSIISVARIERGVLTSDSKLAQKDLMSVENGRWVVKWTGFSSASWGWVPFIVNYCRTRKLGKLQGAGKLETLERAPLAAKTSVFSSDCDHDIVTNGLRSPAVVEATTGPGVWLCGSYAHPGIPLLEACVNSALNVVENGIFVVEGVASPAEWAIR
jgi:microfibrillar-associated protein 1